MRNLRNSLYLLLLMVQSGMAQSVLTPGDFLRQIEQYHPVARQTDLRIDQSIAEVLAARGIFDPQLSYEKSSKRLAGDTYYDHNTPELKLFTPLGISIKTGIENNAGKYLNPEVTQGTLSYVGLEVPVLQGLLIDKKRAALQQAQLLVQQTEAEKLAVLNDLYLNAITDYWYWAAAFRELQLIEQNLQIAQERLALTKVLFANGDKSAADTTEAAGQVLALDLQRSSVNQQYLKYGINLSQYLWGENNTPYMLAAETIPMVNSLTNLPPLQDNEALISNLSKHPSLRTYAYQLNVLEVEQRLKRQNMLPELKLKANLLSKDYYRFENVGNPYLTNNYKFGLTFNMPLFLRESRGEYRKSTLKIEETQSKQMQKGWELETKIRQYQAELQTLQNQVDLAQRLVENYQQMLDFEDLRFSQGESSLFVINSRQNKLMDSYIKLINLQAKYLQTWFKQQWAAGILNS